MCTCRWVGVLPLDCLAVAWHLMLSEATPEGVPPPTNLRIGLALLRRCEASGALAAAASLAGRADPEHEIEGEIEGEVEIDGEANTYGAVMRAADGISPRELQALLCP